jgi:DNA-binding NtrC family response regulator
MGRILIVDDDEDILVFLRSYLGSIGYEVITCLSGAAALNLFEDSTTEFDLILADVNMPKMTGHVLLTELKKIRPEIPVIMISAYGNIESAVEAMKIGAHDYLRKPLKEAEIGATIGRALSYRDLVKENQQLRKAALKSTSLGEMIGKSVQMQQVFDLVRRVSKVTANVLILGESGTGKEMVARAIHFESSRAKKPFVAINCAAIPEQLLESELFGHAKGAFTGAIAQKLGLFEEADGGTIFLDEIADMNVGLQTKLLRVIQEKKVRPVGQNILKAIDVRIIAATHKNLKKSITAGTFREDLYYRLSVVPIHIAPLRDRPEEIPVFADHFLKKFSARHGQKISGFTKSAMAILMEMPWEGNVRQLENTIERAVILCDEANIDESHINFLQATSGDKELGLSEDGENFPKTLQLCEIEKICVTNALKRAGGKKDKAASLLGISRKTLYRKEKEFGL